MEELYFFQEKHVLEPVAIIQKPEKGEVIRSRYLCSIMLLRRFKDYYVITKQGIL